MQIDYSKCFMNFHRIKDLGSGATNFTEAYKYHLLGTVKFAGFISLSIRGYKINNFSNLLNKINFTESYTKDMVLKVLPEPI